MNWSWMSTTAKEDTEKSIFGNAPFEKQEKERIQELLQPSFSSESQPLSNVKSSVLKYSTGK